MYSLENDTTSFDLDEYYVSLDADLPKSVFKMNPKMGGGGYVSGNGALDGRIIKISRVFTKWQETERQDFIKWFTRPHFETLYLRRQTTSFNGISKVLTGLGGGESFKSRNFNVGTEISFLMYMPDPYFESTTLTASTNAISSTTLNYFTVTVNYSNVFPRIRFTSSAAFSSFDIQVTNDYGVHIDNNFSASDVLQIYTSGADLKAEINDNEIFGLFSNLSSPFELNVGSNTLYVRAATGSCRIEYYERQL